MEAYETIGKAIHLYHIEAPVPRALAGFNREIPSTAPMRDASADQPARARLRGLAVHGLVLAAIVATGVLRIALTYRVFFQTRDEPHHLACGMGWLDQGRSADIEHPPLARVAAAIGPYLEGLRSQGYSKMTREGNAILRSGGSYARNLALARAGILPFYVLACLIVWFWSLRLFGPSTAIAATALFSFLPPILGHAGLATTDMAITACLASSLLAFEAWRARPGAAQSLVLGLASGLAFLSKYSALGFLPACALGILAFGWLSARPTWKQLCHSVRARLRPAALAGATAFVVVWAGYRFALTPLTTAAQRPHSIGVPVVDHMLRSDGSFRRVAYRLMETPLPAGDMILGILKVRAHMRRGHPGFLLGQYRDDGWWYFFPVVLAVKTPLAFALLILAGIGFLSRNPAWRVRPERWSPLICAAVMLAVTMPSRLTIGLRHVLPIYPPLAIVAGFGLAKLLDGLRPSALRRDAGLALALWFAASSLLSHPDYLAYFNILAGSHPERIVVDSDLDWGQDLWRLSQKLKNLGVREVALDYFGSEWLDGQGLPAVRLLLPYQPTTGWVAVSEFSLTVQAEHTRREMKRSVSPYAWLKGRPFIRVGKSIRLYYVRSPAS